ncbi:MAG TPA: ATP-binding protein, partial [Kofleriaceae bacterium]
LDVIGDEDAKLRREAAEHPEVPPAFIAGPPLTPEHIEDYTLFKGRSDIIKLIEHDLAPDRRGVLLVTGQRRMGKTSLCNYLPAYLGTSTAIVASNFQPLSGDIHRETPHRRVLRDIARSHGTSVPPDAARWGDGLRWLEALDDTCADRKLLVVIDEVERVEDGIRDGWCSTDFLDFLRAAGDALRNIRFLLLTAYPLHRLGPHWTDRLVSVTSRTISYLGEDDARELITHPIPDFPDIYPEGGVDRIIEQTGRHPYLLQKAGDDLCRLLNSRGGLRSATPDELTEVFDGMIRDVHVFDELWHSRTADEQATLRRLARSDEPGELDPAAIPLAREDYLVRRGDQVSIAGPLFREWIRMNVM